MKRQLIIGVIGAGKIGRLHIENIANNLRSIKIKILADSCMNDEMSKWAKSLGVEQTCKNAESIFADKEIEAVLICSSTDTHADFIIAAAESGKHIFCEKPIALNVGEIKKALAVVEKAGVKLMVGFVRRFDHNHKKVRDYVLAGECGDPHIIKITSRDPAPPSLDYIRRSGGFFFDTTIHDFDMVRFLSGSEPDEIFAFANVLVDPAIGQAGDVDTSIVTIKFKNGALGVIDNSRQAVYGYDQRSEVFGSKGCARTSNDTANKVTLDSANGIIEDKPLWFFLERYNNAFIEEIRAFAEMIIENTEPPITGKDGLVSVYMAIAAYESLKSHKSIKLDEIMEKF